MFGIGADSNFQDSWKPTDVSKAAPGGYRQPRSSYAIFILGGGVDSHISCAGWVPAVAAQLDHLFSESGRVPASSRCEQSSVGWAPAVAVKRYTSFRIRVQGLVSLIVTGSVQHSLFILPGPCQDASFRVAHEMIIRRRSQDAAESA